MHYDTTKTLQPLALLLATQGDADNPDHQYTTVTSIPGSLSCNEIPHRTGQWQQCKGCAGYLHGRRAAQAPPESYSCIATRPHCQHCATHFGCDMRLGVQ